MTTGVKRKDMSGPISIRRATIGFGCGAAVTLAIFVFLAWPAWQLVLLFGAAIASLVILIAGIPLFLLLRAKQLLNVYFSVLLGGLFSVAVPAGITIFNALFVSDLTDGHLKSALDTFLLFFVPGALGGLVGWLVAAGWRVRAT